ncbi:hypothetical protein HanIR_Chr17g0891451 [Helianthus annuus]|nr:hypothetical protein HanIR_Chr17g0891451 [Helianthus annuus]
MSSEFGIIVFLTNGSSEIKIRCVQVNQVPDPEQNVSQVWIL